MMFAVALLTKLSVIMIDVGSCILILFVSDRYHGEESIISAVSGLPHFLLCSFGKSSN